MLYTGDFSMRHYLIGSQFGHVLEGIFGDQMVHSTVSVDLLILMLYVCKAQSK